MGSERNGNKLICIYVSLLHIRTESMSSVPPYSADPIYCASSRHACMGRMNIHVYKNITTFACHMHSCVARVYRESYKIAFIAVCIISHSQRYVRCAKCLFVFVGCGMLVLRIVDSIVAAVVVVVVVVIACTLAMFLFFVGLRCVR